MILKNKTIAELSMLQQQIVTDPANRNTTPDSIYLYTPKARKKLNRIAQAITDLLIERKKRDGTYKPAPGYSGRQTNRRR